MWIDVLLALALFGVARADGDAAPLLTVTKGADDDDTTVAAKTVSQANPCGSEGRLMCGAQAEVTVPWCRKTAVLTAINDRQALMWRCVTRSGAAPPRPVRIDRFR
jgi:hypothetical protein